ncbi:MAG: alpha/beta fold hydrolase [Cryomorphaceae bacterium]
MHRRVKDWIILLALVFSFAQSYSQATGYAQSNGVNIYYQTVGEGTPILVINGGPGFSSEGFLTIAEEIASFECQAILYDQRGTGKSEMTVIDSSTVTMDLMVQDMEALRTKLGLDSWILFGHSFGGMMANYYASKHPEHVSAIIHSSSGGVDLFLLENARENLYARLSPEEIDSLTYWRQRYTESELEEDRRRYNHYLATAYVYHETHVPLVTERLLLGNLTLNRLVWTDMRRINYDCKSSLRSFHQPVLILQGGQDVIPKEVGLRAKDVFSNSELVFLDECGHYGWLDQKEAYLSEIQSFLKKLEKGH